jgi:GDP/UDP-N,N'-diacetylbacillosamine 2-epimerase (hydrolysing)
MGENPETVHIAGLPGGDPRPDVLFSKEQICADYGLSPEESYLLVVQHPVTHSVDNVELQILETLEAVTQSGYEALLANPNDDAGGRLILQKMIEFASRNSRLHLLPPVASRERFVSILAYAGALVGNSSQGIVEAMCLGTPVINIGDRQRGREHLACMLSTDYNRDEICRAIDNAFHDSSYLRKLSSFKSPLIADTEKIVTTELLQADLRIARHPKLFHDSCEGVKYE